MYDPSVLDPALREHLPELREMAKVIEQVMPRGIDVATPERVIEVRTAHAAASAEAGGDPLKIEAQAHAEDRRVAGLSTSPGDVRVRVFRPEPGTETRAVYLHIHGGGWAIGSPEMADVANWQLANNLNVAVVSVDYRLAPEHPYPAGPDDCEAVALWLLDHAKAEFGTDRLLIGGESAGAHLAAVTLLRVRDKYDAIARIEGANLVYGAFDMSLTPSQRDPRDTLVLSANDVRDCTAHFLPDIDIEERRAPDISPLYARLNFLPPALFSCGTADRLLDDTLFMAARWQAAGNRAELALYPEAPHGFTMFPMGMSRAAQERMERFLGGIISGGT